MCSLYYISSEQIYEYFRNFSNISPIFTHKRIIIQLIYSHKEHLITLLHRPILFWRNACGTLEILAKE